MPPEENNSPTPPEPETKVDSPVEAPPIPESASEISTPVLETKPEEVETVPEAQENSVPKNVPTPETSTATPTVETPSEPPPATPQPTPKPTPPSEEQPTSKPSRFIIRDLLVKARATIQIRKQKKLEKIMGLFATKPKISNADIEKLLRVSHATATRYLDQLEHERKIIQVGAHGRGVLYIKSP